MSTSLSLELLLYGFMIVGMNLVVQRLAPGLAGAMQTILFMGGMLIALWGVLGLRGFWRRSWIVATLAVVGVLLLVQAIRGLFALKAGIEGSKPTAALLALLLFFAIGELVNFAKSEPKSGEGPNSATNDVEGSAQRQQWTRPKIEE